MALVLIGAAPVGAQEAPAATQGAGGLEAQASAALRAYRAAVGLDARYLAARRVAAVRYAQGNLMSAQFWLRRAANHAPDRAEADRNRADFLAIRAEARFHPAFSLDIRPSDNVNNGVEDRVFALHDPRHGDIQLVFPATALALPGVEFTTQAGFSYRLSDSAATRTELDVSYFGRHVVLMPEAHKIAPTAQGKDYALTQLAAGLTHRWQIAPDWGVTEARASAGKLWSGGAGLRWFQRLDLSQEVPLPGPQSALAAAYVEHQNPIRPGEPNATLWGAKLRYITELPWADTLELAAETSRYEADIATYTYRANRFDVTYTLAQPVLTLGLSFNAAFSTKSYDEFVLSLDGRRDRKLEIGATAVFTEVSAFGFSPSVTVTAQRTWSNVDRFDTRGVALGLGFRSRF